MKYIYLYVGIISILAFIHLDNFVFDKECRNAGGVPYTSVLSHFCFAKNSSVDMGVSQ